MKRTALVFAVALIAAPGSAQTMTMPMPKMAMPPSPKAPVKKPPVAARKPAPAASGGDPMVMNEQPSPVDAAAPQPHAGHGPPEGPAGPMPGMAMPNQPSAAPEEVIGSAPAPAPPSDHAADAIWGGAAQSPSRAELRRENGAFQGSMILFNLAEYQARKASDGYRWEGEGWFGGDINRLVIRAEGEGELRGPVEKAEFQALYGRAIDPWWNVVAGVRYDMRPNPQRAYAAFGVEGLAPYWFRTSATLFVSTKGEILARAEGFYDQRITQRLVLQPRAEVNFSSRSIPETRVGRGLTDIELGARLRYELRREFAPYVGVEWASKIGETGRFARQNGQRATDVNYVAGIRFWF